MSSNQDNRAYAKADQGAFNYTESQAESTFYAGSLADHLTSERSAMDEGDDRMSRVSMYTYKSGDLDRFLKKEKGRVKLFDLTLLTQRAHHRRLVGLQCS